MSAYQFKFSLVPLLSINKAHGTNVAILKEYMPLDPESGDPEAEDESAIDYWDGIEAEVGHVLAFIEGVLPPIESWDDGARMFSDDAGNKVEVWLRDDGSIRKINCRLDVRNFNLSIFDSFLELARTLHCVLALNENGRVIPPDRVVVAAELEKSRAYRFCFPGTAKP